MGVSHYHLYSDTPRQARDWEGLRVTSGRLRCALVGGCCHGEARGPVTAIETRPLPVFVSGTYLALSGWSYIGNRQK